MNLLGEQAIHGSPHVQSCCIGRDVDQSRFSQFGEAGLLCGGEWLPWLDQSVYLTSATLDARAPRSILFSFDKLVPGAYGAPGLVHVSQGVPIPADAPATDLALLQSALTRRCPSARVALA